MKEPIWIDERDALALHDRLLALDGGAPGVRDEGQLKSALARAQQMHAYAESPNLVDMAAAYTAGIVRNHPFIDGIKRTGFVVGILFLEMNGYSFLASEEDAAQAVLKLAAGTLDKAGYETSCAQIPNGHKERAKVLLCRSRLRLHPSPWPIQELWGAAKLAAHILKSPFFQHVSSVDRISRSSDEAGRPQFRWNPLSNPELETYAEHEQLIQVMVLTPSSVRCKGKRVNRCASLSHRHPQHAIAWKFRLSHQIHPRLFLIWPELNSFGRLSAHRPLVGRAPPKHARGEICEGLNVHIRNRRGMVDFHTRRHLHPAVQQRVQANLIPS